MHEDSPVIFWVGMVITTVVLSAVVFAYALPNIRLNKRFAFRVYNDHLECESPAERFGPSFELRFSDIEYLEENAGGEGPSTWAVVTNGGNKFSLTPNYGNPVRDIIAATRQARPDLEVRDVK
ncbi:MAG: hypothetical protein AB1705_13725 [Verrucomicrobiota bacterium]